MEFPLSAQVPSRVEADIQERDAQFATPDGPFLSSNEHLSGNTQHRPKLHHSGHWYSLWAWEITSILFSILCMGASIAVLLVYHSKAAPTLPSGLTLNALVSLLATISKAAMLVSVASCISQLKWHWFSRPRNLIYFNILDEASRGPSGSFELLLRTQRPTVVGLGAFITILALGADPFMQQIISYPTRSVETGSTSIARAQMYDTGSLADVTGGVVVGPELGMKAAIYNGIFSQSGSTEVTSNCPTGNCTFPLFDSLAFCSKCKNVTDTTILSNHTNGKSLSDQLGNTIANYTYSLPGNYTIVVTAFLEEGEDAPLLYGPAMISNFGMPESMSQSQLDVPHPISSLAVLQFPQIEQLGYSGDYLKQTPLAWQCALYFCLQTYNTTVINGVPKVDTVSSWNSDLGTPFPTINNFPNDYSETNDTTFKRPEDSLVTGGNDTFFIPGGTIAAMASYLNHTMSGFQLMKDSEVGEQDDWPNDVMQALNSTVNITSMMAELASSITFFMRQSENRGSLPDRATTGISLKRETYVHVRWPWIGLPVTVLLLSTIFLVTTMIRASQERMPVWKSSTLPMLFHGLNDDDNDTEQSTFRDGMSGGTITDMKGVAETTKARLRKGENGEWNMTVLK